MAFDTGLLDDLEVQIAPPPPRVPGLVLHVDGDYLAYFASGNDERTVGEARQKVFDILAYAAEHAGATEILVHNTLPGGHKGERYLIATVRTYQEQRSDGRKPKNQPYLANWLIEYTGPAFKVKNWATREADDGIGACALYAVNNSKPGYVAILTADKDLRMLPGLHLEWRNPSIKTVVPPGAYAVETSIPNGFDEFGNPKPPKVKLFGLKWFWMQMLTGDTADNIPGLEFYRTTDAKGNEVSKRMGEKTAEKLLAPAKTSDEAFTIVADLYKGWYVGDWANRFVEQAALLWMRCDAKATVLDFCNHQGHSRINTLFCSELKAAAERLDERVRNRRSEIQALSE